jgi:Transglycosylase SLT domain
MKIFCLAAVLIPAMGLCWPAAGRAQIASYIDGRGNLVFMNDNSGSVATHATPSGATSRRGVVPRAASTSAVSAGARPLSANVGRLLSQAARRNQLDPALVRAVVRAESGGNPRAVSCKGAQGLMQLIPATAQRFDVKDVFDPAQNLEGGSRYLRILLLRYDGDLDKSLAAYNAGEHAVEKSGGVPNYPETRNFVQRVTDSYFGSSAPNSSRPSATAARDAIRSVALADGRVLFTN